MIVAEATSTNRPVRAEHDPRRRSRRPNRAAMSAEDPTARTHRACWKPRSQVAHHRADPAGRTPCALSIQAKRALERMIRASIASMRRTPSSSEHTRLADSGQADLAPSDSVCQPPHGPSCHVNCSTMKTHRTFAVRRQGPDYSRFQAFLVRRGSPASAAKPQIEPAAFCGLIGSVWMDPSPCWVVIASAVNCRFVGPSHSAR